jgi:hypothetical protein
MVIIVNTIKNRENYVLEFIVGIHKRFVNDIESIHIKNIK